MRKVLFIILLYNLSLQGFSQSFRITGNIKDSSAKNNSLLMAIRFTDSVLVNFTRSDEQGIFKPVTLPVDTYIVIITHPSFSDKTYLLVPNPRDTVFNFKNVVLPEKSVTLNEVEVIAHKDKMYYKGDTLNFTADSFKVRAGATVEDLLKKLPGVKVDAAGKITIQGKQVDQVLVDGDEFFGSDPTIATRNLNANTVETIQVFEKKNDNTESGDETLKVVNLKLKEDAKNGYFGKITGASDFQKFYENDVLLNRFKKNFKMSLFGLVTNTPKQAFGWNEANQYGINDNAGMNYDPETNSWTWNNDNTTGIPQTIKSGFYFSDKYGKYTKVNSDYTFRQNTLNTGSETNTQFFLEDTNYTNKQTVSKYTLNQGHTFNLRIETRIDSLTELVIKPKGDYTTSKFTNYQTDAFLSSDGANTRETRIYTTGNSEKTDGSLQLKVNKNFMKKDRQLQFSYFPSYNETKANTDLQTQYLYLQGQLPDSTLLQKRSQHNLKQEHSGSVNYTEPFTQKLKGEIGYGFTHNLNSSSRLTKNFTGQNYDFIDPFQSNDFRNIRQTHRVGGKISYEVKKYRLSVGTNFRSVYQENLNVTNKQMLTRTFNNVVPFANANFRINQGSNLQVNYHMQTQLPDLQQLQPVVDNTDPNRLRSGNPDLKVQLNNNLNMNYYFYKGLRDIHFYSGGAITQTINDITDKTSFDSLGRSFAVPVNVNGNYNGNTWLGGEFPLFKRFIKISGSLNTSFSKNNNYINTELNTTQTYGFHPTLTVEKELEWLELTVGGGYNYDITKQTINVNTNQNYYSYNLNSTLLLKLPAKFKITGEATYTDNGNRSPGYNLDYFIVNAGLSKGFFKGEALTASINGFDLLNQNISNERQVNANSIVDTKTQIIKRYFLLRLVYKFTSQKAKDEEEDEDE